MREPPLCAPPVHASPGITPACAGTTLRYTLPEISAWDHPRVCGNHLRSTSITLLSLGSPPRVREPPSDNEQKVSGARITPACAGTTVLVKGHSRRFRDHPRVCGNHIGPSLLAVGNTGSPPRVREPLLVKMPIAVESRITPACAGTTDRRDSTA